ncbi:MAG: LamG-like jellyroll fold domain-containing protein [Fidelibacterota bacterium]
MMKMLSNLLTLAVLMTFSLGQTVIFSEDFESGTPSSAWEQFYANEDVLQAVPMSSAPAVLAGGGDYVGYLQDVDGSYTGIAAAVAGDISLQNYTIEADVYCYVNDTGGSAYTGVVVYADSSKQGSSSHGFLYKLVADFDANNRFRLYNNQFNMTTFSYTFSEDIDATGLYSENAWHHMKLVVNTVDTSTTTFTCYFDGNLVGSDTYTDTGIDQADGGKFGIFSMQMDADGIAGYFDNIVVTSNESSSNTMFADDFETGTPSTEWELFYANEDELQAIPMSSAPTTLANGGDYVGYLQDVDASYTGIAVAVAGEPTAQNYTVEADVYCYVNDTGGSAYTGVVAYADSSRQGSSSHGFLYKLVADFDADHRFRLYNNQFSMTTFSYTFSENIDATGLYTDNDWHHMKLVVNTPDTSTTTFTCYFDGNLVGADSYSDTGIDQADAGKFGIFSMQMDADGIAGYFDNVMVTANEALTVDPITSPVLPVEISLEQNYPNPFNPSTSIAFQLGTDRVVSLDVINIRGEQVKNLVEGYLPANRYRVEWDGRDESGRFVPSGVYLYTLNDGQRIISKKMLLVK